MFNVGGRIYFHTSHLLLFLSMEQSAQESRILCGWPLFRIPVTPLKAIHQLRKFGDGGGLVASGVCQPSLGCSCIDRVA